LKKILFSLFILIILPFQGANGLSLFCTQGDAVGLGYTALSGRKKKSFAL